MINDPLRASVLSVKLIPNVDAKMAEELNLPNGYRSIGIIMGISTSSKFKNNRISSKKNEISNRKILYEFK